MFQIEIFYCLIMAFCKKLRVQLTETKFKSASNWLAVRALCLYLG